MKTFKIKNFVLFAFVIALSLFCINLFPNGAELKQVESYALFTTTEVEKNNSGAQTPLYTPEEAGSIPFSLYTSKSTEENGTYVITDFYPDSFVSYSEGEGTTAIHYYSIKQDSIPYIMLSSNSDDTKSYNTTVFFKFNDQDFKTKNDNQAIISSQTGYASIQACYGDINGYVTENGIVYDSKYSPLAPLTNSTLLATELDPSQANTSDGSYTFALNLKNINDVASGNIMGAHCPKISGGEHSGEEFGGVGDKNDASLRAGLYTFVINYTFQDIYAADVSNKCVFVFQFYVLDYNSYVEDTAPLTFTNTDTYTYTNKENEVVNTNYEIYNYNYTQAPYVEFDATKFAMNFVYTTGYTNYAMQYNKFDYNPGCNETDVRKDVFPLDKETGKVTLTLKDSSLSYQIPTYKRLVEKDYNNDGNITEDEKRIIPYYASFDLADFEKFVVENKINSTNQGEYTFSLDFLIKKGVPAYVKFDNSLFRDLPTTVTNQKLVLFGYNLKYYKQDPTSPFYKTNVELKNDVTHTNFIAYNSATLNNNMGGDKKTIGEDEYIVENGFLKNIPEYVAITDQAPLRFDYYGNLSSEKGIFYASFATYDYKTIYEGGVTQEQRILNLFNECEDIKDLENNVDSELVLSYIQGSSISNDGLRVMKLFYTINVFLDGEDRTIEGIQYFVFEINNSIQNLYIQAVDFKDDTKQSLNRTYDFKEFTNKDVRINIEERPNTFFAPLSITYNYYSTYNTTDRYTSGSLTYKTIYQNVGGKEVENNYSYNLNGKVYNYLVTNNSNNYSFTKSGAYKITIKSIVTNIPSTYDFTIDKDPFTDISVNKVSLEDDPLLSEEISTTIFNGNSAFLDEANMYITADAFSLGWDNKPSNAKSFVYFYFMASTDNVNLEGTLFKTAGINPEYWLTNGITISAPGGADTDYINYKDYVSNLDYRLKDNSYFNLDGLYFFYVYDEAGNFFTRTVLIDSSLNTILQGEWQGKEEESTWVNTFDPDKNPANYVNSPTTIYFGDYKALKLPTNLADGQIFSFEDDSFVRAYEYTDILDDDDNVLYSSYELIEKPKISFDFYNEILTKYTDFVKKTDVTPIIGKAEAGYYLTLENTLLTYEREYEEKDENGNFIVDETGSNIVKNIKGNISEIYKAKIYDENDPTNYRFNDEGQYYFVITNINGKSALKDICMNFDVIQGTFWAYSTTTGDPTERLIRKNNGTNLDVLKFVYNNLDDETASYYKVKSLTFKHYEFVLDESSLDSSRTTYPFSNKITNQGELPINKTSDDGTQTLVDNINLDASNKTIPGKYILTRTYVGGTHNLNTTTGKYEFVGTGGSYYQVKDEFGNPVIGEDGEYEYKNLFTKDVLVRSYTVYVDRNGIISTEYMIREDKNEQVREVGDRISITLSQGYEDDWDFKEFFLTSSATLSLDTNKVPVMINIPLSKFFVYYNSVSSNLYAKQSFANLEIKIAYKVNAYTATKYFVIDGFDSSSGMCTCSSLVSNTNPLGHLIFNGEGEYTIYINDKTGYADTTSVDVNARNTNPTTYTYSFKITHVSPEAQAKTHVYDYVEKEHFDNVLTNEYSKYNFATNIKQKDANDDTIANNEFIVYWSDPDTPYQAKIKQANLTLTFEGQSQTFKINLENYNLLDIASNEEIIDTSNCEYIEYFTVKFFEGVSTPKVFDFKDYYRYEYSISLNIEKEYVYKLELSYVSDSQTNQDYIDDNGKSFATSNYSLIIDRTKPNTNIDNLLKEESYLTSSNYYTTDTLNNFKEEVFDVSLLENTPSAFTYSFGVNNNYQLKYNENETLPYFFVRSYQNYKDEYPSITPDMNLSVYDYDKAYADYANENMPTYYPIFKEINEFNSNEQFIKIGDNTWHKVNYQNNVPLKDLIAKAISPNSTTSPNGFYEIIERDLAGNYRNFTVYYNEKETLFLNLEIDGYTQKDNFSTLVSMGDDAKKDNISANIYFELTQIASTLGWGTLTITNSTTNVNYGEQIYLTPFDNGDYNLISQRLESLNNFMKCELNSKFTFSLSKYNATYTQTALTRHINLNVDGEGKLEAPVIEEVVNPSDGKTTYNLILPVYDSKRVLYLENFTLQLLKTDTWQTLPNYSYVGKENIKAKLENLEKGVYKAIYQDNFNSSEYSYILYVGEYYINDFNKEYKFEYSTYFKDTNKYLATDDKTIYYSGGDIEVTYESNIYKVFLTMPDGKEVQVSGDDTIEKTSTTLPNCKTFKLSKTNLYDDISSEDPVGGLDIFTLKYVDITDNSIVQKVINFGIFNALPEIYLTNAYGGTFNPSLKDEDVKAAPSIVTISWESLVDNNSYFDINSNLKSVVATLYTKNSKGIYANGIRISKGQVVTEEGQYKLEIKNEVLGNYREIYFAISFSDVPLYSISSNGSNLEASPYEKLDFSNENDRAYKNEDAISGKIIEVIYEAIVSISSQRLPIADRDELLKQMGFTSGRFDLANVGICNVTQIKHFYRTDKVEISYNSNIELNIIEFCFKNNILQYSDLGTTSSEKGGFSLDNPTPDNVGSDYWTTIFLLYNLNGPIKIEFFALTKVPKTTQLLETSIYYKNEKNDTNLAINLNQNPITTTLTNTEIVNSDITVYWNALPTTTNSWYNRGNVVLLSDKYGVDTIYDELNCSPVKKDANIFKPSTIKEGFDYLTTTLVGSGLHNLVFKDFAGNQHTFAQTSYSPQKYYSIILIDKVIYNINYKGTDLNPIQYGVFNDSLDIVIDTDYIGFYSQLTFLVTKNGNSYSGYTKNEEETIFSFNEPGKYSVTISAFYGEQKTMLNNVVYNFTIIHSNSARLAYEFVEILGYEVLEVTRNNQNITHTFDKDNDGRVFSLFISPTAGGNGYYTVKLKYGQRADQVLTYSFTINDYIPTISTNVAHGETTTSSIIVSYNPSTIYEQLGECYIKILTYNNDSKTYYNYGTITIDADSFTSNGASSFEITRSNSYFIQVETKNGNIISSFRVNKTDPLNTMAIIIIIVAVIAVVVLIIIVVKLRTRMKIK